MASKIGLFSALLFGGLSLSNVGLYVRVCVCVCIRFFLLLIFADKTIYIFSSIFRYLEFTSTIIGKYDIESTRFLSTIIESTRMSAESTRIV